MQKWQIHAGLGRGRPLVSFGSYQVLFSHPRHNCHRNFHSSPNPAQSPAETVPLKRFSIRTHQNLNPTQEIQRPTERSSRNSPPQDLGSRPPFQIRRPLSGSKTPVTTPQSASRYEPRLDGARLVAEDSKPVFRSINLNASPRASNDRGSQTPLRISRLGQSQQPVDARSFAATRPTSATTPRAFRSKDGGSQGTSRGPSLTNAKGRSGTMKGKRRAGGERKERIKYSDEVVEKDAGPIYSPGEQIYMAEKATRNIPKAIPYDPPAVANSEFAGLGPAVILSHKGLEEVVEQRLRQLAPAGNIDEGTREQDLVAALLSGRFIKPRSAEEKERVLKLAEAALVKSAETRSEDTGELVTAAAVEYEGLSEAARSQILGKLVEGRYPTFGGSEKSVVPLDVLNAVNKNESFVEHQVQGFTAKIRSLMPLEKRALKGAKRLKLAV